MRNFITTGVEVVGGLLISLGAFQIWQPAGFIITGMLLITAGALSA